MANPFHIFITGGAGFIGCNLAATHLARGSAVTIYDNLSRPRTQHNVDWLRTVAQTHPNSTFNVLEGDVRDFNLLQTAVNMAQPDLIVHLAAQVAVTTSVTNPREDFEINALGTFNVLEAARTANMPHGAKQPTVFYASTNKVYGGMHDVITIEEGARYRYRDLPDGVSELQPLDFHSPYGCSKGTGDQYVRDYARIYGMRTVVFRQGSIYGTHQFGVEDQGWVAYFAIAAALNKPLTIYGNGKQVRDLLHVRDLIAAYDAAWKRIDSVSGQEFNVGGGTHNNISIWAEFGPMLEKLAGHRIDVTYGDWRPGDQPIYVSDTSKAEELLGWKPHISIEQGVTELWNWVAENKELLQ